MQLLEEIRRTARMAIRTAIANPPTREGLQRQEPGPSHLSFHHYTDVPIRQTEYRANTAATKTDDAVQVLRYAARVFQGTPPNDGPAKLNRKEAPWVQAPG
jgi:hypothetical protein